jgi:hypothetical protein
MREWFRPAAPLDRALRRAARGLHPRQASSLGPITPVTPQARVTEVFAPAIAHPDVSRSPGRGAAATTAIAVAGLLALAATASAAGRLRRRSERPPATLARKAR